MVDCNRICIPLFVSTSRSIHHSWLINGFLTRVNRSLNCLREHTSPTHGLRAVHAVPSLVFCVVFCRLLFVLLTFFVWSLCCLFFFDWRIMITPFDIFKLFVSFKTFSDDINTWLESIPSLVYRWRKMYWQLYCGSVLTILSLLCLTMAFVCYLTINLWLKPSELILYI
jgi:hypothetical protein